MKKKKKNKKNLLKKTKKIVKKKSIKKINRSLVKKSKKKIKKKIVKKKIVYILIYWVFFSMDSLFSNGSIIYSISYYASMCFLLVDYFHPTDHVYKY